MAKARVHELAKEFGVPSKDVLAALKDMGEFVKSASSTVEAPVARRLEELHGDAWKKAAEEKAAKKAAKKAPAKKAAADNGAPAAEARRSRDRHAGRGDRRPGHHRRRPAAPETLDLPRPRPHRVRRLPRSSPHRPGPSPRRRPPPRPRRLLPTVTRRPSRLPRRRRARQPKPGTPRPGNNPFSSTQGMQRRAARSRPDAVRLRAATARDGASGAPRPGGVPGAPRPNPAMMPRQSAVSRSRCRRLVAAVAVPPVVPAAVALRGAPRWRHRCSGPWWPRRRLRRRSRWWPAVCRSAAVGPVGGGRNQRGTTQGAFGRPGGPSRRGRKSKRARRQEYEQMQAPTTGGVRVRKGDGETVRLSRGASLTDFADKVGVDAASLVQVLFAPRRDGDRDPVRQRRDAADPR